MRVLTIIKGESMELSERKKKILAAIVERYIQTGEPVGSKVLCGNLAVSSATVRNEMSELSELGFLDQPHTSAGRIPSQQGLRYYVNNLMARCEISDADRFLIENRLTSDSAEPQEILSNAAKLLTEVTGCASVALTPYDVNAHINRVELIPISSRAVLVVLVVSTGVVKSRICRCDTEIDISFAELFYNIAAAHFTSHRSDELTIAKIQSIAASLGDKAFVMTPLLFALYELAHEASRCSLITEGQTKLLGFKELEPDVYKIFECLKTPSELVHVLNSGLDDFSVSIGRESRNRAFENTSIVSSKYSVSGKNVGAIGIIGPLRIDYARFVPNIICISETVGKILSETINE